MKKTDQILGVAGRFYAINVKSRIKTFLSFFESPLFLTVALRTRRNSNWTFLPRKTPRKALAPSAAASRYGPFVRRTENTWPDWTVPPNDPEEKYWKVLFSVKKEEKIEQISRHKIRRGSIVSPINQSINQSMDQSINRTINPSINQSINLSIYQSINLSHDQSINQSINQSIDSMIRGVNVMRPGRNPPRW